MLDLLEGETSELLHYLGGALHLLALEGEERLLWVVELLEVGPEEKSGYCNLNLLEVLPGGGIVENVVILLSEGFPNLLVLGIKRHGGFRPSENLLIP